MKLVLLYLDLGEIPGGGWGGGKPSGGHPQDAHELVASAVAEEKRLEDALPGRDPPGEPRRAKKVPRAMDLLPFRIFVWGRGLLKRTKGQKGFEPLWRT